MEMNSASVEAVVKQVLESMLEGKSAVKAPAAAKANTESNGIPKTAHVAMLTALENYESKRIPDAGSWRRRYSCKSRRMRYLWNRCS